MNREERRKLAKSLGGDSLPIIGKKKQWLKVEFYTNVDYTDVMEAVTKLPGQIAEAKVWTVNEATGDNDEQLK